MIAAVAAVLIVPIQQAHSLMGLDPLLLSFIVVIIGGLGSTNLVRLTMDGEKIVGEERLLQDLQPQRERIRDVRQGPDGWLYVVTDNADGRVLRLER